MDDRTIYRRSGKQAEHEGARILIAEDSPLHRALITIQLTMAGYVVEEVYNGIEAVSRIEKSAPGYYDAVIMDVYMPVIDGIEAVYSPELRHFQGFEIRKSKREEKRRTLQEVEQQQKDFGIQ